MTLAQVFSCEFCEISKNIFFTEHLWTTASGVIVLIQRKVIPSTLFTIENKRVEDTYKEINLHKKKLINCTDIPHKALIENHLQMVSTSLDTSSTIYDQIHCTKK